MAFLEGMLEGVYMPAEWEPHAATWLAWPHNQETWPTRLPFVQRTWIEIIKTLHLHEPIHLLVNDATTLSTLQERFQKADIDLKKVRFHQIPTNDCWLRDTGPTFVKTGPTSPTGQTGLTAVCWQFNSWGEKWPPWDEDAKVATRMAETLKADPLRPGIVMEGGSFETNGTGTLLTTESCLLNKNRNPNLTREDIESLLKQLLGILKVIWLQGTPLEGDDTDGHIDNLARFVSPTTIVTLEGDCFEQLKQVTDQAGRSFKIIPLPVPEVKGSEGRHLPASYANFYIANGLTLLPVFGVATDELAIRTLKPLFPGRRIVPIECRDLVLGFGGVHCVTQQQPLPSPA